MNYDGIVGMQKIEEHAFLIVRRKDHWRWNLLWIHQALQTVNKNIQDKFAMLWEILM